MVGGSGLHLPSGNDVGGFIDKGECGYKKRILENKRLRWFSDDLQMLKANSFYRCKKLDVTLW